ncbi:MAG: AAA family ATPase [Candidatus Vogelbacteria bacterium]|nr:AAA family ATPase [Candidatus Vogelbacteria bacterium]
MNQAQALDILKTGANVFLTGEPGAGKTHTINEYILYLRRCGVDTAVTASTGIAATHLSGMTIHSWSGIGIRPKLNHYDLDKLASTEYLVKRISRAKVLIIDEVSMLGPETLTMVDQVCREIKDSSEAFGGMQIVFVGDFFQLPPIVRYEAVQKKDNYVNQESLWGAEIVLDEEAKAPPRFAFASPAWEAASPMVCYLTEQHRQDDPEFLQLLSAIRRNEFEEGHLEHLGKRKVTADRLPTGIPKLYTHNLNVDAVNENTLRKIPSAERKYKMVTTGKEHIVATLKKGCLSPELLTLKIGAEVMFTKNKPKDGFVNGTLGVVESFAVPSGNPVVKIKSGQKIEVAPMMGWSIEENGKIKASLTQIPLRLAWAITVHKSQGMSMDAAVMDLRQVFEYGQGYVALSRVRRLDGIHILGWNPQAFKVHPEVFAKDESFRASSEDAEEEFSKLKPDELEKMHDNFVTASGGKKYVEKPLSEARPRTGVQSKKTLVEIREKHANAFRKWDEEQEKQLKELFGRKVKIREIAKQMGRRKGGIQARLEKIGLIPPDPRYLRQNREKV